MRHSRKITRAASAALLVVLSTGSALGCASWLYAVNGSGKANCSLISGTSTSCTYECTCWGDCSGLYPTFGLRRI